MNQDLLLQTLKKDFSAKVGPADSAAVPPRLSVEVDASRFFDAASIIQAEGVDTRLLFATGCYAGNELYWVAEILCGKAVQISLRARVGNEVIPSLSEIWEFAEWQEKEAFELFGIRFHRFSEGEPFLLRASRTQFPHRRQ